MKRALAAALVALLLAPAAQAKEPRYDYPDDLVALLPGWIAEAESRAAPSLERAWYAEAAPWLEKAKEAADAGRLRVAMFHLETYTEIVVAHQLLDEVASLPNDAERKTRIVARADAWNDEAEASWAELRRALHAFDADARGLQTIEEALYGADVGLAGILLLGDLDGLSRDFPTQRTIEPGYVTAIVRASHTALLNVDWARDIVAQAARREGLPPRVLDEPWANLSRAALADPGSVPNTLQAMEARAKPARANNETLLSLSIALAEQRAARASAIQGIFGDARTRGLDVVNDAARGMRRMLNNTTMETPRGHGLEGVFHADAIDRALYTDEIVATGNGTLAIVIVAWSALEHAGYVLAPLSTVSPVEPQEAATKPTPGAPIAALVAVALVAAVAVRRR